MWYDIMSAVSNLVMAAFAVIAGIYAKGQYDEAKQQRELALRQEAKQDELALRQQQEAQCQELKHEQELLKANNRALFLERQREIAHVEAFAVKNGREYAVELSVPTEASIYEVRVWAQWPDEDFLYDNAAGNRDSSLSSNPHVARGRKPAGDAPPGQLARGYHREAFSVDAAGTRERRRIGVETRLRGSAA